MAETYFIDTNIFLRHLRGDHPDMSPRAQALLERIERQELKARTADTVVFETVYTLQRGYKQPKAAIRDAFLPLLELRNLLLPRKKRFRRVFQYYVELNISFADAYHAVLMEEAKVTTIYSFDAELDRVPTITRLEP